MSATTTTRKPRPRTTARNTVNWVPMPEDGSDALRGFAAAVAGLRDLKVAGPVPRFWTQAELAELARIGAEAAEAEQDGHDEARSAHEQAHAAVWSGWHVPGLQPPPLETFAGCGDPEPRTAAFTRPAVIIPVAEPVPDIAIVAGSKTVILPLAAASDGTPGSPAPGQDAAEPEPGATPAPGQDGEALGEARTLADDLLAPEGSGEGEKP